LKLPSNVFGDEGSLQSACADDIIAIADYLTERNRVAARAVEGAIRRAIELLSEFPGSGRVLTQRSDVRIMPVVRYPYLIFFSATSDEVLILHVRHGSRAPVKPQEL
jgi:plasmid stabilization system protein ParE